MPPGRVAHSAVIEEGIHRNGYRAYVARDLDGHRWTIARASPRHPLTTPSLPARPGAGFSMIVDCFPLNTTGFNP